MDLKNYICMLGFENFLTELNYLRSKFEVWLKTCLFGLKFQSLSYRPVGRAVTRSFLERKVWGSKLGPVKLDTVSPRARHRCDIFSKGAVFSGCNDAEMGAANSLHTSELYSEYNEKFDLKVLS